jgi:hypothetical protein
MTVETYLSRSCLTAVVGFAVIAIAVPFSASAADDSAISTLFGTWGGSGRISYTDGSSEAIRCTSYYKGGGGDLNMVIQCKSEKNPIHIRSKLHISGGHASGDWEERTFNASGTVSGNVGSNNMSLSISGGGFSGSMSVSFTKNSHSVNISTQGIAMSRATISFGRR